MTGGLYPVEARNSVRSIRGVPQAASGWSSTANREPLDRGGKRVDWTHDAILDIERGRGSPCRVFYIDRLT